MALRILVCSSEVVPFAKTGGLADVAGALPKALASLGHEVGVALPKYAEADSGKFPTSLVGEPFAITMGADSAEVRVEVSDAILGARAYLVDCPQYFHRDNLYGEPDDAQRFAFFCRAVLEFLRRHDWLPQVIHANDWQTGLIPVYLRTVYHSDRRLASIATLYTVHNLAYQGIFGADTLDRVGLDRSLFTMDGLEFYGQVNFMKGGLRFADVLNTVSEAYSREIQTAQYGERLDGVLASRVRDLFGVLNGVDYQIWDPATDRLLAATYDARDLSGKASNKLSLQRRLRLSPRSDVPLFGLVSRLASQKGLDILGEALPHLLRLDIQFAFLGMGERECEELLAAIARQHPGKVGLHVGFDDLLAHQIYAGSDFFLMPSRYEPCGLGQLISLRYGTIPVVRHTGGLADTVIDFSSDPANGNGFSFQEHTAVALFGAVARGLLTMRSAPAWKQLVHNAMACDFSWERSAKAYAELYQRAIARRGSR